MPRQIALQKKEPDKAISDFNACLEVNPNDAGAYNDRGLAIAQKACELSNHKAPTHLSALAAAYAETGDFNEAAQWMKKALEFPDYAKTAGAKGRMRLKLTRQECPITKAGNR